MAAPPTPPRSALLRRLRIEPGEVRLCAWAAAALAIVGWADISVQNAAEPMFIKRVGVAWLPWAFLASSLALLVTTYAVGRFAAQRDRLALLPWVFVGLALMILPLWAGIHAGAPFGVEATMVLSQQIKSISLLVFWVAMGDLLHGRQAKRLFAPLMAGLTLGTVGGSFASKPIGGALGIEGLLIFSAALLGIGAFVTLGLRRAAPPRLHRGLGGARAEPRSVPPHAAAASVEDHLPIWRLWRESLLFRALLVTTFCAGLLGPMLQYVFYYVSDQATAGEQGLLALYAPLRGWLNLGILATQLALASRLYRRIGIPAASALSPVIYVVGFVGLIVQLTLTVGIAVVVLARLQAKAVYEPALRVLFNLFPEELRERATALLEEPIERAGAALGNIAVIAAISFGGAAFVSYAALPFAIAWLATAAYLWRAYPTLLIEASARADRDAAIFDPATLRGLSAHLENEDTERACAAVELVSKAPIELAVGTLAGAVRGAPAAVRPVVVEALDRLLERTIESPVQSDAAAREVAAILEAESDLADRDRADLVQAYGRLTSGSGGSGPGVGDGVLERAASDPAPAVRLAALAALQRAGVGSASTSELDPTLREAVQSEDPALRRTAREELRALVLTGRPDPTWEMRLGWLAELAARESDRLEAAEALAEIALRHGPATGAARPAIEALQDDRDVRVRAAVVWQVGT